MICLSYGLGLKSSVSSKHMNCFARYHRFQHKEPATAGAYARRHEDGSIHSAIVASELKYRAGYSCGNSRTLIVKFDSHNFCFLSLSWLYFSWLMTFQHPPSSCDNKRHFRPTFKLKFPHLIRHGFILPLAYIFRTIDTFSLMWGGMRLDVIIIFHLPAFIAHIARSGWQWFTKCRDRGRKGAFLLFFLIASRAEVYFSPVGTFTRGAVF